MTLIFAVFLYACVVLIIMLWKLTSLTSCVVFYFRFSPFLEKYFHLKSCVLILNSIIYNNVKLWLLFLLIFKWCLSSNVAWSISLSGNLASIHSLTQMLIWKDNIMLSLYNITLGCVFFFLVICNPLQRYESIEKLNCPLSFEK